MTTSHAGEKTKECIQCGTCLDVCPLFTVTQREELSPKAKHMLASRLQARPEELSGRRAKDVAALCVSCGKCEKACPQGLCGPDAAAAMRAAHPDMQQWLWKTWIQQSGVLWPAMATLAKLAPKRLPGGAGADHLARLKAMLPKNRISPWLQAAGWDKPLAGQKAVIFPGCLAARLRTEWTRKTTAMLQNLGAKLSDTPGFSCCGCTLGHAGAVEDQKRLQRHNQQAWRAAGQPLIFTFCATCRCGLRAYPASQFLDWKPGETEEWLNATRSLPQVLGETTFTESGPAPDRVFYHAPCHGAGSGQERTMLQRMLGSRLAGWTDKQCCGLGGVMQLAAPELSVKVAQSVWNKLQPRTGDVLVTGCSGCVLQLTATAPAGVTVGHWLECVDNP